MMFRRVIQPHQFQRVAPKPPLPGFLTDQVTATRLVTTRAQHTSSRECKPRAVLAAVAIDA